MKFSVTVRQNDKSKFELVCPEDAAKLNPKELVLYAAALCANYTLQHLLRQEHLRVKHQEICVSGTLSTPTLQPEGYFTDFHVCYHVECNTLEDQEKVSRAVQLTQEKHCGLIHMLRKIAPVSHEIAVVSTESVAV